jgi:trans-aconitate 2-methyltransferase
MAGSISLPGDQWDPGQYNRFADERERPFWDLAELLAPVAGPSLLDLGCGDGRLTAALGGRLGAARTLGLDNSRAMIGAAASRTSPALDFELGDIADWAADGEWDIVFSNAALHWLPDHRAVLGRWLRALRPGGQLAVQVPANADHPAHRLAGEVAAELLANPPPDPVAANVLAPEAYAALLDDLGCQDQQVRLQVYVHHLGSTGDVAEWLKGSTLTRFKEPLGPERWTAFVERFRERLLAELGEQSPYAYTFKRILIWGQLPGAVAGTGRNP